MSVSLPRRRLAAAALLALAAGLARGDGGRVRLRREAGSFAVTVFTAPEPLRAGPADVSVLVQNRATGEVVLDAAVEISAVPPDGGAPRRTAAAPGRNRLLEAASVELGAPGEWRLDVTVRRGAESASLSMPVTVEPSRSRTDSVWPYLAAPPIAIALFALRTLRRRSSPSP